MTSPYLHYPLRSPAEARRDQIAEMLRDQWCRLRNLPLDDKRRGDITRTIVALEAELDTLDDGMAT